MPTFPRLIIITIFSLFYLVEGLAQVDFVTQYNKMPFDTNNANHLLFQLEDNNFFKNNEYFGVNIKGYTLLGYSLEPSFVYYAGKRLRFKAGINAVKYHGKENFSEITPVLSVRLKLSPLLEMTMGALTGTLRHQMMEPLYDHEWQYTQPVEQGLQFVYTGNKLWVDTWLNWEQFIQVGDTLPEVFFVGMSARSRLLTTESGWSITAPLQMLAQHTGGQIDVSDVPMQTVINFSPGLEVAKKTDGFFNTVSWFGNWLRYKDLTESNPLGIYGGSAFYTGIKSEGEKVFAMIGYWTAHNFIAPKGSYLFQSVSVFDPMAQISDRQLLTGKLAFFKTFSEKTRLSLMVEGYFDFPHNQFDYSYGLHLAFTPRYIITKAPFF